MRGGWRALWDWKAPMLLAQVLVACGCVVLGTKVMAQPAPVSSPAASSARTTPASSPVALPVLLPSLFPGRAGGARPLLPSLTDLAERANRDDLLLYREQWQVVQTLGSATSQYFERHVVPMLLAAARGGVG